jgi:hypothetical protein
MGVWLRQADGREDLGLGRGRGDTGDPFPGGTGNSVFHAASLPSSLTFAGGVSGLTIVDIEPAGDDISFRLSTRSTTLTFRAEGTATSDALFTLDGQPTPGTTISLVSPPFVQRHIEVVAGESLGSGARRPFVGWADGGHTERARTILTPLGDVEYVAQFGGTEYELALQVSGGVAGVEPASFVSDPASADLWFPGDTAVSLTAVVHRGFVFSGWSGALAGQQNPALFTMSGPLSAGADFELVYAVAEATIAIPAATDLDVQLEVEEGTLPVRWRILDGSLPLGVVLSASGRITGASLDVGRFDLSVEAVDATGLPATGAITLQLQTPAIALEAAAAPFLLSGPTLTVAERGFLAYQGNGVAGYDLGDFRAWILAQPSQPFSAELGARVYRSTVVIPMDRPGEAR